MMICGMPLSLLPGSMLENLASYVERLKHAVLAALAMMTLVVAVEFLDGLAVLSLCPEAIAFVLYGAMEFFSEREHREENVPFLDFVFRTVAAVGFTLMTGLYAAFLGTDHYSVYLKAAMFVLLLAVLSSLSRLACSSPFQVPQIRGATAIEIGIAFLVFGFPAAALLAACPLVFKVKNTTDDPEKNATSKDEAEEHQTKKILKRSSSFAQATIVAATGISTAAFSVGKDVKLHQHVLVAGGSFLVIAFLSALLLIYMKLFLSEHRKLHPGHVRLLQFLCLTSGAALVATNSVLLLLINEGDALLALNLLPVQIIIATLAWRAAPTEDSLRDEAFEATVKSGRKVALFASATAFAVQTTLVFGYLNNSKFQALAMGGHRLDISASFLASALSVFLVVATCMPIGYASEAARDRVLSIIRCLKDAVIAVLAVTAVTLGQEFLGGNAALALFPEIAVAAIYYAVTLSVSDENASQCQSQEQGDAVERKMEVLPASVVATFGFGMLGAAYAALLGTPEYDVYTKALVFTLLAAVMSSLGRVAGPLCGAFRRDKNAPAWVVFLSNILPVVEMLVAVPLAAKVVINFLPAA